MNVSSTNPLGPNAVYNPGASSAGSSTSVKVTTILKKKVNEEPASSQPIPVTAVIHTGPLDPLLEEGTVAPANSVIALEGPSSETLVDEDKRSQSIFRRCFPCCIKPQN